MEAPGGGGGGVITLTVGICHCHMTAHSARVAGDAPQVMLAKRHCPSQRTAKVVIDFQQHVGFGSRPSYTRAMVQTH